MTFREKLQKEHPEHIGGGACGGCYGCPCDYDYEPHEKRPCVCGDEEDPISCEQCWNREIPGTEEPSIKPDLNALIERAATKKDISLSIFITGDSTHISVYPCPDPSEKSGNPVAEAYKLLITHGDSLRGVSAAIKKLEEALE